MTLSRRDDGALCVGLVGMKPGDVVWLRRCLGNVVDVEAFAGPSELDTASVDVVIVDFSDDGVLDTLLSEHAGETPVLVVTSEPDIEDERVFFCLSRDLSDEDVAALVLSARLRESVVDQALSSPDRAARLKEILSLASRFATRDDLDSAARIAEEAAKRFGAADRSYCLFHDPESGIVWTEGSEAREHRAASGLVGFAARTGRSCLVEWAADDARFDARLDDPQGDGERRLLVQPVVGNDGRVQAVLVAVRGPKRRPFTKTHRKMLSVFAEAIAPKMQQLALMVEADRIVRAEHERRAGVFRAEAVDAYVRRGRQGDVVRVSPSWIRWAYWLLVGLAVAGVVYLCFGRVEHYSTGTGLIRLHDRAEVVAPRNGAIVSVEVESGDLVRANEVLARLDDTQVRAPADGIVGEIRTRPGQRVAAGDIVLSLLSEEVDRHVVALLPGADRPQLRPGMNIRLEIDGYPYAYQSLVIEHVSRGVVGPGEAARYLGPQYAETLKVSGPVAVVRARLDDAAFESGDETYRYHDGMRANAEVAIRSEPIIVMLFPFFKALHVDD